MTEKQSAAGGNIKHLRVGITGGIGSGKSIVSKALAVMGYPVYNSDERAKELMQEDTALINKIKDLFGSDIYSGNVLNRQRVASLIFNDPVKRQALNAVVHPAVRADFVRWTDEQKSPLVFQESALLFETGSYQLFDHTILVTAPEEIRINRVLSRDSTDREAVVARMKNQLPDSEKIPLAGTVIVNDDRQAILPQLNDFLRKIQSKI